jgi:Zn-dependent protease
MLMFGFINFADAPETLVRKLLILLPVFLISITLHEFAHAATANAMGDTTPAEHGRVTVNPIAHLDPIGTVMILFGPIGWAKPVPIDPARLGRFGTWLTSAAGPLSNLLIAALSVAALKHLPEVFAANGLAESALDPFRIALSVNLGLAIFNLLPIPPLDGSQMLYSVLPQRLLPAYHQLLPYGVIVLVALVMLPIGNQILGSVMTLALAGLISVVP